MNWNWKWVLYLGLLPAALHAASLKTENVFLITSDGLRWQEVFEGAEERLINAEHGGVKNTNSLRAKFWRDTPGARREALLPFFWTHLARHGQLIGNQNKGSVMNVTNGRNFSYPGYNELITGAPDPRIDSNDKKPNPNANVFEWFNTRRGFKGKVAVMGTWDVFPWIFNCERSGVDFWPTWETRFEPYRIKQLDEITQVAMDTTRIWESVIFDSFLFHAALTHIKEVKPRLMFIGFGETDEWGHAGRYDHYLQAARKMDNFVEQLWRTIQSMRQYKNKTTFIITTDHGRGKGLDDWKSHGEKVETSEGMWLAVIGPDTPALGERSNHALFTQSQIAATIVELLGEDYRRALPMAAPPIDGLIGHSH